ncbi:MAG: lyase family protein [Actinomycetota bacterium]|nr:lyase family protein [Actinomycetota bacterium]
MSASPGMPARATAAHGAATRDERDFLGVQQVPQDALYGIGTHRALRNSGVGGLTLAEQPLLLDAMAEVKSAAALANVALGCLATPIAEALVAAASEVTARKLDEHFPLEIVQGGGGTALNTNVNEVLANRATVILGGTLGDHLVDPHSHANLSQSTNDVFPTAMCLAVYRAVQNSLAALDHLRDQLIVLAETNEGLEHLGRSCLQDALPVPVSQVHLTHERSLARARKDLYDAAAPLLSVPLGGTAVGTGLGAPSRYAEEAVSQLRELTGLSLTLAEQFGVGLASLEPFAAVADAMARAGRSLARVAGDIRLLSSGPVGGIGEVVLPALQAGSSIMPGKVNPVLPELVIQVHYQLAGAATIVAMAAASVDLEVTPMGPVASVEILQGLSRLEAVARMFADRCLTGLRWHRPNVSANLEGSFADAVELSSSVGFEKAARTKYADVLEDEPELPGAAQQANATTAQPESRTGT